MLVVSIDRPQRRNAVDAATAEALREAFLRFEGDDELCVAVLSGARRGVLRGCGPAGALVG